MTAWPPPPEGEGGPALSPEPARVRRFLDWFFASPTGPRTAWSIILWWELRRVPYNLIVGAVGICSFVLFFFFITHSGALGPGEDAEEPMAVIAAPLLINLCYTGGPLLEVLLFCRGRERSRAVGPELLRAGLYFSLAVVLAPAVLWGLAWVGHLR